MRTISKGAPRDQVFKGVCHHCNSVIEADRNELRIEYDQRESGDLGRGNCPECKHPMIFYPKVTQ